MKREQIHSLFAAIHAQIEELERQWIADVTGTESKWAFPKDNYTVLAIWLLHDPKAQELFPVKEKKSWAELAEKLTKYVGWAVDAHILRQNFTRKNLKNTKKAQNTL